MKRSLKKTLSLAFFILVMDFIFIYVLKHNSLGDGGLFINQGLNLKNSALAVSYNRANIILNLTGLLASFLILLFIMVSGISAKLRDISKKFTKIYIVNLFVYMFLFLLTNYVLNLPLNFYSNYIVDHAYHMSNQTLLRFFSNSFLNLLINIVFYTLIVWIPLKLYKRSPKRWWIYTGILCIPVFLFTYILSPIYIDPLFNKFKPLENNEIKSQISILTKKAKIKNCDIYEVMKSTDTSALNAYMTGIFNTKRIVIWDTSINKFNKGELSFIVAHEMGHYVLGHVLKGLIMAIFASFLFLYLVHKLIPKLLNDYGMLFKVDSLKDYAAIPLVILFLNVSIFLVSPFTSYVSRVFEHEADTFALELTRDNKSAVSSFEKLSKENLSVLSSNELYEYWFYDHPSLKNRIIFSDEYKPWEKGESLKFQDYMEK